jgi:hypothetical protein
MFGRFTFLVRFLDRSKRAKPRLWPCKGVMELPAPACLPSLNES